MSKTGGTTTTSSESGLPAFQQPYVDQQLKDAQTLYQSGGPQYYPGDTVAGFTDAQTQAQNQLLNQVAGQQQTTANTATDAWTNLLKNSANVNSDPNLASAVSGAIRPTLQQLTDVTLPSINRGYETAGGAGSSREGIAQGLATARTGQSALDTASKMYSDAYQQGQQTQLAALNQTPTIQSAQSAPAATISAVGQQQQEMNQAKITEDVNRYTYNQNLPYQNLTNYANMIKGPFGGTGSSTTVAPTQGTAEQIAGGLLTAIPSITALGKALGWF